ncbi:MAG: SGNH/GDSL hydrolase family protein [Woeseiaceae bacterium]
MRNYILKITLLPILFALSFFAYADASYSKVYIFGDSLSDTGNLASIINIPPPYFNGRITNGPVAVETLTAKLGTTATPSLHLTGGASIGDNFSVAGATAIPDKDGNDLDTQILVFQANHGYVSPSDALYVIFLGGNDVRAALHQGNPIIAESILSTAASKIESAINTLYQSGARHFMVINVPNIGLIPETSLIAKALNNPLFVTQATNLTVRYNEKLHEVVKSLDKNNDIDLIEFNLYKLFNKVFKKAEEFGFSNNTNACFESRILDFHPDCQYGANVDSFFFFDEIHPTQRVHAMFGEAFYNALDDDSDDDHDEDLHEEDDH